MYVTNRSHINQALYLKQMLFKLGTLPQTDVTYNIGTLYLKQMSHNIVTIPQTDVT